MTNYWILEFYHPLLSDTVEVGGGGTLPNRPIYPILPYLDLKYFDQKKMSFLVYFHLTIV